MILDNSKSQSRVGEIYPAHDVQSFIVTITLRCREPESACSRFNYHAYWRLLFPSICLQNWWPRFLNSNKAQCSFLWKCTRGLMIAKKMVQQLVDNGAYMRSQINSIYALFYSPQGPVNTLLVLLRCFYFKLIIFELINI